MPLSASSLWLAGLLPVICDGKAAGHGIFAMRCARCSDRRDGARQQAHVRGRHRARRCASASWTPLPSGRLRSMPSCTPASFSRTAGWSWIGHDLRFSRTCVARSCTALAPHAAAQECAHAEAPLHQPATIPGARAATWRTTTISTAGSTASSSTRICNTAAPTLSGPTRRWRRPSLPRSGLSRQSSCSSPTAASSTSAPGGADSGSTSRRSAVPRMCTASRYRPSNSASPPSARASAGFKTRCASRCRTTAT